MTFKQGFKPWFMVNKGSEGFASLYYRLFILQNVNRQRKNPRKVLITPGTTAQLNRG